MRALKHILIFSILSSTILAKDIELKPLIPIDCSLDINNESAAHILTSPSVVFENAEILEIKLLSFYGNCIGKKFVTKPVSSYAATTIFSKGLNFPWTYVPVINTSLKSEKVAEIHIEISKSKAFKSSHKTSYSLVVYGDNRTSFRWKLDLKYEDKSDTTKVKLLK